MNKEILLEKEKRYFQIIENTVRANKKNKKKNTGHFLFNKSNNPFLIAISTFTLTVLFSIGLTVLINLSVYIAVPVATATGIFLSYGLPKILHAIFIRSKGKLGRGYAKMELDSMFAIMQKFFGKLYAKMLHADFADDVSEEELNDFVGRTNICAKNYKSDLDKYVGKRIYKRNLRDYKKIMKIVNNSKNESKSKVKIDKIIRKNEKFTKPWCDLYNKCGKIAQNLFLKTNEMNDKYKVPDKSYFMADYDYLVKKVSKTLKQSSPAVEVEKNVTFENDEQKKQKVKNHTKNPKIEKLKKYFEDKLKTNDDILEQ